MEQLVEVLKNDSIRIVIAYSIFLLVYFSNVCFSIFRNIRLLKDTFDKKKFLTGILKCFCIVIGTLALVISVDLMLYFFGATNTEYGDMISVATILGTIGTAIVLYIKEAYQTLIDILQNGR